MAIKIEYFQKINNLFNTKNRRESELYELNQYVNSYFDRNLDYEQVEINGKPFELQIIKDTDGNVYKKKIKARPGEKFNLGDSVLWNGQHWLVVLLDSNDKTYNSGYMYICNCCLRWQNDKGKIIERWVHIADYTKYSSGIYNNGTIIISDNQYGVLIGADEETKKIKRDMRFPVDFEDAVIPNVYKVTNRKANLSNYEHLGRGATIVLVLSASEFNKETDRQVELETGQRVWICNYKAENTIPIIPPIPPSPPAPPISPSLPDLPTPPPVYAEITGNKKLKINHARTYTVTFTNGDKEVLNDVGFNWEIDCDFVDKLLVDTSVKNKIKIKYTDMDLIDKNFRLHTVVDGDIKTSITIELIDLL